MPTIRVSLRRSATRLEPEDLPDGSTIEFAVAEATTVRLDVFDLLGREVARSVNEVLPAGAYRSTLALRDFPGGTYLYRLQAGDYVETKRMVVVK